jgi:hypothetical protein
VAAVREAIETWDAVHAVNTSTAPELSPKRMTTGHDWLPRIAGVVLLGLGAAAAYWLPAMIAVAVLVAVLLALAVQLSRDRGADAAATSISES